METSSINFHFITYFINLDNYIYGFGRSFRRIQPLLSGCKENFDIEKQAKYLKKFNLMSLIIIDQVKLALH